MMIVSSMPSSVYSQDSRPPTSKHRQDWKICHRDMDDNIFWKGRKQNKSLICNGGVFENEIKSVLIGLMTHVTDLRSSTQTDCVACSNTLNVPQISLESSLDFLPNILEWLITSNNEGNCNIIYCAKYSNLDPRYPTGLPMCLSSEMIAILMSHTDSPPTPNYLHRHLKNKLPLSCSLQHARFGIKGDMGIANIPNFS